MANNNVRFFKVEKLQTYTDLQPKDSNSLYWVDETQSLYLADKLYGTGQIATEEFDGLLSAEDYKKLQELIDGGIADLTPIEQRLTAVEGSLTTVESNLTAVNGHLTSVDGDIEKITGDLTKVDGRLDTIDGRLDTVEASIVGGIHYMGSVTTREELDALPNAKQGDLYEVTVDGSEWCYNGTEWFEYGTSHFVPVAGDGIIVDGSKIGVKIATDSHGLTTVDGSMALLLATTKQDGAMSKEDKAKLDAIPEVYVAKKYEITNTPVGTLIHYGEKEIRIMCPDGAEYNLQNVGAGGDSNTYYVTFKTYAPSDDAIGYIEHLGDKSDAEILKDIKTDQYGHRYQPTWLGVATYDEATGTWNYYGKNSSADKFIGWDYQIDWYDANDVMIASDRIRINLSNEDCHHTIVPSYMANYAESSEIEALKATIAELEQVYSWGDM